MNKPLNIIVALWAIATSFVAQAQQVVEYNRDAYLSFESTLHQPKKNMHTVWKPFLSHQVDSVMDVDSTQGLRQVRKPIYKWLFNKHFISVNQKDFSLSIDPIIEWKLAYQEDLKIINARGFWVRGRIGEKLSFTSHFHETQGRYPNHLERLANAQGIIPGQGKYKFSNELGGLYDFQWAGGLINYQPSRFFNIQFGHGKNFIGDGYRSLFLSDVAFNYPHLKITTQVWNLQYVNLFSAYNDIRAAYKLGDLHPKKYASTHLLSWNLGHRLNINVFETVIWHDTDQTRGFEVNYLNPIIFFRPVDYAQGSPDNVLLGAGFKFKLTRHAHTYGQLLLDEFRFAEITAANGWWANKFGLQWGLKSYHTFGVQGLTAQAEFNLVRPFTYSHQWSSQNYAHHNQALAHPLGANFKEGLLLLDYQTEFWTFSQLLMVYQKGLNDTANWGGDIYESYTTRAQDYDNVVGQGTPINVFFSKSTIGYLLNPRYRLYAEAGAMIRQQSSSQSSLDLGLETYVFAGLRTRIFNHYYEF